MHEALEACNHAMRGTYFDDLLHLKYDLEQQLRVPISQTGAVQVYFSQHFHAPNGKTGFSYSHERVASSICKDRITLVVCSGHCIPAFTNVCNSFLFVVTKRYIESFDLESLRERILFTLHAG